jgi:hypothetical protein
MQQQRIHACECTYTTTHPSNIRRHRAGCKASKIIVQLAAALEASRAECKQAKDELQRLGSMRRGPGGSGGASASAAAVERTTVVALGAEDYAGVTPHMFAALVAHPQTAVRGLYTAIRRVPGHRNVHIPNKRENIVQVYAGHEWVLRQRDAVLRELVHSLADRIAIALETAEVRALVSLDAIARWAVYHDSICTSKGCMAECVTHVELVILGERIGA